MQHFPLKYYNINLYWQIKFICMAANTMFHALIYWVIGWINRCCLYNIWCHNREYFLKIALWVLKREAICAMTRGLLFFLAISEESVGSGVFFGGTKIQTVKKPGKRQIFRNPTILIMYITSWWLIGPQGRVLYLMFEMYYNVIIINTQVTKINN